MCDKTAASFTCCESDEAKILAGLDREEASDRYVVEPGIVQLHFEELNYAGYSEMERMQQQGLVFYGSHDYGGTYSAGVYCCDGRTLVLCDSDSDRSGPVGCIGPDGSIAKGDARKARRYWEVLARTKAKLQRAKQPSN